MNISDEFGFTTSTYVFILPGLTTEMGAGCSVISNASLAKDIGIKDLFYSLYYGV